MESRNSFCFSTSLKTIERNMPISLKRLWHASAHVRQLDFCSGEQFFKIGVWWRNPLPSTLRRPRKPWYQYSRAIWSIWEVLNAIYILYFCASIIEKIWSHWGELYDTCALSWHSSFNEKAERAKEGALTCPYPSWRQSPSAISSPSLLL